MGVTNIKMDNKIEKYIYYAGLLTLLTALLSI